MMEEKKVEVENGERRERANARATARTDPRSFLGNTNLGARTPFGADPSISELSTSAGLRRARAIQKAPS